MEHQLSPESNVDHSAAVQALLLEVGRTTAEAWHKRLRDEPAAFAALVLERLSAPQALKVLGFMGDERREAVLAQVDARHRRQWEMNREFPVDTVGRLMELPVGVYSADLSVAETTERLRSEVKRAFITYGYVTDADGR